MLKIKMFDVEIDSLTMGQTIQVVDKAIKSGTQIVQNSINANKVVLIKENSLLKKSLIEADIVNADGQSIIWASKLLNKPLPERVSGIDLFEKLLELASLNNYKVFLLGAKEGVVKSVLEIYNTKYNAKVVVGYQNGYFKKADEKTIIETINKSGAEILFVAIPSPRKEIIINQYKASLSNVKFLMGVGGSFDVVSGNIRRAPIWMQIIGLEWLFRLFQEPQKMWKRYFFGNLKFIKWTIYEILTKRN